MYQVMIRPDRILCLLAAVLLLPACRDSGVDEINFEVVLSGDRSSIQSQRFDVINDAASFDVLWEEHGRINPGLDEKPVIDFDTRTLFAIFLGVQTSGGYSIETDAVVARYGQLQVNTTGMKPGQGCIVTLALTQPFQFVTIEKSDRLVSFNIAMQTFDCE